MMNSKEKALVQKTADADVLDSLKIDREKLEKIVSLDEVYGSLGDNIQSIVDYRNELFSYTSPSVEGHWYRLGGTSAEEINKALKNIVFHVKSSLNIISLTEQSQSKSIQDLCVLIGLLAIAEARLYSQFRELTEDSDASLDILVDYEKKLTGIATNSESTEDNIRLIATTLGDILEQKNKQVLSFKAAMIQERKENAERIEALSRRINELENGIKERLDSEINVFSKKSVAVLDSFKNEKDGAMNDFSTKVNGMLNTAENKLSDTNSKTAKLIEDTKSATDSMIGNATTKMEGMENKLNEDKQAALKSLKTTMDEAFEEQDKLILKRTRKTFLDSGLIKVGLLIVSLVTVAAMVYFHFI